MRLFGKSSVNFVLMALIGAGSASTLYGDTMLATYAPAKTQTPNTTTLCGSDPVCWIGEQTFSTASVPGPGNFPMLVSTGAAGAKIAGSYSGGITISNNYEWGGAGGTGYYPTVTKSSYTLTLTTSGGLPGVNYFGLWFSALDGGNELQFYENSTLLYTFTPTLFASLVGACPNASNAFCGNPNNGEDANEQFAFLNFYDETGYFNKIVFTETTTAGFESDNHTVGYMDPVVPTGTPIVPTPEPGSIVLLSIGMLALIGLMRHSAVTDLK
jgi:hypothetical protein